MNCEIEQAVLANILMTIINSTLLAVKLVNLFVYVTDSTVLAYVLKALNQRYDYGVNLVLLSVDEGITGYRDDSLEVIPGGQRSNTDLELVFQGHVI